jgi:hypothetical protein
MRMINFPSIGQFRNAVKTVTDRAHWRGKDADGNPIFDRTAPLPTLDFVGTEKLHGCVHKDTLITLADGSQERIADVIPGTYVLVWNSELNQTEPDVVDNVIIQELPKDWVELHFDNGSRLKCTVDHPILTTVGWIEAQNLTPHHDLITDDM